MRRLGLKVRVRSWMASICCLLRSLQGMSGRKKKGYREDLTGLSEMGEPFLMTRERIRKVWFLRETWALLVAWRANLCRKYKTRQNTPSSVGYKAKTFNNTSAYYINCFRALTSLISGHVFLTLKGECLYQGHLCGGFPESLCGWTMGTARHTSDGALEIPPLLRSHLRLLVKSFPEEGRML